VADITTLQVDAIVNAANEDLIGAAGVAATIQEAAGPEPLQECRSIGRCPTGQARLTRGYRLPARFVIHAVGPVYQSGREGEAALLQSCYTESLKLAAEHQLGTIAFPCISTGIFGYPNEEACVEALKAVLDWIKGRDLPGEVVFCCFSAEDHRVYRQRLGEIEAEPDQA